MLFRGHVLTVNVNNVRRGLKGIKRYAYGKKNIEISRRLSRSDKPHRIEKAVVKEIEILKENKHGQGRYERNGNYQAPYSRFSLCPFNKNAAQI